MGRATAAGPGAGSRDGEAGDGLRNSEWEGLQVKVKRPPEGVCVARLPRVPTAGSPASPGAYSVVLPGCSGCSCGRMSSRVPSARAESAPPFYTAWGLALAQRWERRAAFRPVRRLPSGDEMGPEGSGECARAGSCWDPVSTAVSSGGLLLGPLEAEV